MITKFKIFESTNLAPNGKPSKLNSIQYDLVRSEVFKEWFGDWENDPENSSKVIDENGEPLIVYHGTPAQDYFTEFNTLKGKIVTHIMADKYYQFGSFFTNSKETAKGYSVDLSKMTKKAIDIKDRMEILLDKAVEAEKDGDVDLKEEYWKEWKELSKQFPSKNFADDFEAIRIYEVFLNIRKPYVVDANGKHWNKFIPNIFNDSKLINDIIDRKIYDGIIIKNVIELYNDIQDTHIVFDSKKIKLADGTNKTFDKNKADIRH